LELTDYWRVLRSRWRAFVAMVVLGLGVALLATVLMPRTYTASAELFVAPETDSSTVELLQGSTFILNRVKSYVEIADTELVLGPVIRDLELQTTVSELSGRVTATVRPDTVVVRLQVSDDSPDAAARIANAVSAEFQRVAPELEPVRQGRPAVVRVTVVSPAEPPVAPASPRPRLNIALGLLAGLAAGLAAAVAREVTDRRVVSERDIAAVTDAPIIGRVPDDPSSATHPVLTGEGMRGARAEAMREVRISLQFLDVDQTQRSYVVTSALPGEGKTATAINLAVMLAELGQKVCLLDADLRRPAVGRYLDLEPAVGLTTVLIGATTIDEAVQVWGQHDMHVLPSGQIPPNPSELLASDAMKRTLVALEGIYDIVIIDSPPLLPVTDAAILAKWSAGAIVVVASGRSAVTPKELALTIDRLQAVDARVLGLVRNRLPITGPDAVPAVNYRYVSLTDADAEAVEHPSRRSLPRRMMRYVSRQRTTDRSA
jgi:succinoglycan biosynthesis transport protein ExoP